MGKAVVLGGTGFIGSACVKALLDAGFRVTGVGRTIDVARQTLPGADWLALDVATLDAAGWRNLAAGADVVVNAAGALQDGARDNLQLIHVDAVETLVGALGGTGSRLVQISAAGAGDSAPTWFMRSKWLGDRKVMASGLQWWILRPVLVFGPQAYGGTALLRAAAGLPGAGLVPFPDTPVQVVHVDDVAAAVVECASGAIASGLVADLAGPGEHSFAEVVRQVRNWQGFPAWKVEWTLPHLPVAAAGRTADALGWLGWRPPLRSSALSSLRAGITGDMAAWKTAGGRPCRSLAETLAAIPSGTHERWFARLYLLLPLAIAVLSVFWLASGAIGLWQSKAAMAVLSGRGFSEATAALAVHAGSLIDMGLGVLILLRRFVRHAAIGMVAISAGYVGASALWTPDLWADPLGPMVKVVPGMMLAGLVAALMEER